MLPLGRSGEQCPKDHSLEVLWCEAREGGLL